MEFVTNEWKNYFKNAYEKLKKLDEVAYENGLGHFFTEKELRKFKYASEVDRINEYAYPVMQPTIDTIIAFAEDSFLNENPQIRNMISQLISYKSVKRGGNKKSRQDRGAVERLKDNIKEYLENPTQLPKAVVKKKDPVKPGINQSKLKQPRVFTLKDKDELVKPNEQTWQALRALEKAWATLIKANIEHRIDNQNPTENWADRMFVSWFEELQAYKDAKVLLKKDDDKIRDKASTLAEQFESYIKTKTTPLEAASKHSKLRRQFFALKRNVKKSVRKQEQIEQQLVEQGKTLDERLTETTPIKDEGKNK